MSGTTLPKQTRSPMQISSTARQLEPSASPAKASSATESSADEAEPTRPFVSPASPHSQTSIRPTFRRSGSPKILHTRNSASPKAGSSRAAPPHATTPEAVKGGYDETSDDNLSPVKPPSKRAKRVEASPSSSDSESERRAHLAQLKGTTSGSGMGGGPPKKGVRQPIKRGGKRF
jgi:hypothetical protein